MLYDEPTSALDTATSLKVINYILSMHKSSTIVIVTHEKIMSYFSKVYRCDA